MALTVFFVRHGHAENNRDGFFPDDYKHDYKLTDKGIEQVKQAAEQLLDSKAEAIFSSPVYRVELGNLRNRPTKEIFENNPDWFMEYFNEDSSYGLEKYGSIRGRMLNFVKSVFEKGYTRVIAVSHLEPIRALITLPLNVNGKEVRKIEIHNASISTLRFEDPNLNGMRILSVDCVPINHFFT